MKHTDGSVSKIAMSLMMLMVLLVGLAPTFAEGFPASDRQAQHIFMPMVSPAASVSQTIGVTWLGVSYHRPAVNDRELWGSLVPYGQVWRTGANENTVLTVSTEVQVEGETLAAGTYGIHTIPGEERWTVIFSHDSNAWGSFSYDESRDALRVEVEPTESAHTERMSFRFDDIESNSVKLLLEWGTLRVPITFTVDEHELALASFRDQLKGLSAFFWQGWNQAANYCLQNEINYEEALQWADRSVQTQENFTNLSVKAQLLAKTGDEAQSKEILSRALEMGNSGELHNYARTLLGEGKKEEALEVFQRNVEQNSNAWFVELGLARGLSALGRFEEAAEQMKIAVGKAPDNQKAYVQGLVDRLEKGEDIN